MNSRGEGELKVAPQSQNLIRDIHIFTSFIIRRIVSDAKQEGGRGGLCPNCRI